MRQWEISSRDADDVPDMLVNMITGTYWGASHRLTGGQAARLFTSMLVPGTHVGYHCIAWSEL